MKTLPVLVLLAIASLVSAPQAGGGTTKLQLTLETNGPALPEAICDFYVPPTRSREAYAATHLQVFHLDDARTNWTVIYAAPPSTILLGLGGYARASSVLYVIHSRGVARTRDEGGSWIETVPPDYSAPRDTFLGVSVNPTNRREAALAFRGGAWLTSDFGESFNRLALPTAGEPLVDVTYAGDDSGVLVVLTESALHCTANAGETWLEMPVETSETHVLATSAKYPAALVTAGDSGLIAFDLARPGFRKSLEAPNAGTFKALATDCAGRGLVWAVRGTELLLLGEAEAQAELLATQQFDQPVRILRAHPRQPDQVLCASAGQLVTARLEAAAPDAITNLWDLASFSMGPFQETNSPVARGATAEPAAIQEALNRLTAGEPPLNEVLLAALRHAQYSDKEIARWKKRVRARNWLPEFRVGSGFREYPADKSEIYSYVDRYGIPRRDDLRLSDRVEPMGYVGVTLVWDLSRLLYDPEEADTNKEKRYEIIQRNALITQITSLYYERLELLLRMRMRSEKMTLDERISSQVKLRQKTELLNGLCGLPLFVARQNGE